MRGGARNRSGPAPDPKSGRSDARGYSLTALPSGGFEGEVPDFPLPDASDRELDVWAEAWETPQACAWSIEPWSWAVVAEYCRLKVTVENGAAAAFTGQLHRYRDQLGLTPAGLRFNGWVIAPDEVSVRREQKKMVEPVGYDPRSAFKAVQGGN